MSKNGSTQWSHITNEESSGPTVTTESVLMISITCNKEEMHAMLCEKSNIFTQKKVHQSDKRIMTKIRGVLVIMLLDIDPEKCQDVV